jgi:hypothetical protein
LLGKLLVVHKGSHGCTLTLSKKRPDYRRRLGTDSAAEIWGNHPSGERYLEATPDIYDISSRAPHPGCHALEHTSAYFIGKLQGRADRVPVEAAQFERHCYWLLA